MTDHASELRRHSRKLGHPSGDTPSVMAAAAEHIDAQAAEIERLRAMLAKARAGLSCGLWDYGPGQSEHEQCDDLLAEIDAVLGVGND